MNILETEKRAQILNCLVEGCSMRSTARLTGAAKKTIERLLVSAGEACADYQDRTMRNLKCKRLQVDEIWSFTYCKQKRIPARMMGKEGVGDTWTWIALDAETKLIPCWRVDARTLPAACHFINDLKSRLAGRVQLTSDGLRCYVEAVEGAFGADVDFAQLIKIYENPVGLAQVRYSAPVCIGSDKRPVIGCPEKAHISTSFVERSNLTWRMSNRRLTRLTNAFSKKIENHKHMIAISMMHYNFCRIHSTLRVTPAMEAGLTDHVWSLAEVVDLTARQPQASKF